MPRLLDSRARWLVLLGLSALVGVAAGVSSAAFLVALRVVTDVRVANRWLVWLLPAAGLVVGSVYHYLGGRSAEGSALLLDEIHSPTEWVPRRLAPTVFLGTVVSHLFGASVGREGAAVQMTGSLTDLGNRVLGITGEDRRRLLVAAVAGGFGAVFGVPLAGVVFAIEVQARSRRAWSAVPLAVVASFVGDRIVRVLGVGHMAAPSLVSVRLTPVLLASAVGVGVVCGLVAASFIGLTHGLRAAFRRWLRWPPLRPMVGGAIVVGLTLALGTTAYLGLSEPLIAGALTGGSGVVAWSFAAKLVFTSVSVGSGLPGGEVTPLFVIGATLGVVLGAGLTDVTHESIAVFAALGFVAVFAGAANTPLACAVMAAELFGFGPITAAFLLACFASTLCSPHHGIYGRRDGDSSLIRPYHLTGWVLLRSTGRRGVR